MCECGCGWDGEIVAVAGLEFGLKTSRLLERRGSSIDGRKGMNRNDSYSSLKRQPDNRNQ
jgi:hypothetical protein